MAIRILLVDKFETHRQVMMDFIRSKRPDIEVHEYDPIILGMPDADFDWQQYNLLIMDSHLSDKSGLDWLHSLREIKDAPGVVFLSSQDNVDIAVAAMKLGAKDFILKKRVKSRRLRKMLSEHLPEQPPGDLLPDLKPMPEHHETQQYTAADTQVLPKSAKPVVEPPPEDEEFDDKYWDQQTQVLSVSPKVQK